METLMSPKPDGRPAAMPSPVGTLSHFWSTMRGPKLYKIYPDKDYVSNLWETCGDFALYILQLVSHITLSIWPLLAFHSLISYLFYEGTFSFYLNALLIYFAVVVGSYLVRGYGRLINNDYLQFIDEVRLYQRYWNIDREELLKKYDFEFAQWPEAFRLDRSRLMKIRKKMNLTSPSKGDINRKDLFLRSDSTRTKITTLIKAVLNKESIFSHIINYLQQFLIRIVFFPGSLSLVASLLNRSIADGRRRLIVDWNGQRAKLLCREKVYVDSLVVDRRNSSNADYGKYLVICCDSGYSFYETSSMVNWLLRHGFSTLAYNRVGFGSSSPGAWNLENERLAVDVVINYAADKLRFRLNHVLLVGSGVGNYAATWAASQYPEIRGLIVHDLHSAPIYNLLAHPIPFTGISMENVLETILPTNPCEMARKHLTDYTGPVSILGRGKEGLFQATSDQKVTTSIKRTNKATGLLVSLLKSRFPILFTNSHECDMALGKWFTYDSLQNGDFATRLGIDWKQCENSLASYMECQSGTKERYPCNIGHGLNRGERVNLLLYLAARHWLEMPDLKGDKWTSLTIKQLPWNISDFLTQSKRPSWKTFTHEGHA